ncbi:MAG: 30S ribosomal protein S20 [Puniceicoccales bacterium]|jgi:small subunit ribosomal protein S20|nr:30S ribosomal protein S20 [Puniceicoccales bacterium]
MANKKAAKKSIAQAKGRASGNGAVRSRIRTLASKLRAAAEAKASDVQQIARAYISALDKAAKRHIIHRNAASRRKSVSAKFVLS